MDYDPTVYTRGAGRERMGDPRIHAISIKMMKNIPLTAEEQAILAAEQGKSSVTPSVLNSGQYGLSGIGKEEKPAEQQYTPEELEAILGMSTYDDRMGQLNRQYESAKALRDMKGRQPDTIQISSGTSYTPAKSTGETVAEALRSGVGAYGMKRAEDRQRDILKKEREARKAYGRRVLDPVSETGAVIRGNSEKDLGDLTLPKYDLGEPTIWERLRSLGGRF